MTSRPVATASGLRILASQFVGAASRSLHANAGASGAPGHTECEAGILVAATKSGGYLLRRQSGEWPSDGFRPIQSPCRAHDIAKSYALGDTAESVSAIVVTKQCGTLCRVAATRGGDAEYRHTSANLLMCSISRLVMSHRCAPSVAASQLDPKPRQRATVAESLIAPFNVLIRQHTQMDPLLSQHSPDRFMRDLRQVLSQGRKRIGLLIGAGAPLSVVQSDRPLIPALKELTKCVMAMLDDTDQATLEILCMELGDEPNIEDILTRVRQLSLAIGVAKVHGLDGGEYKQLAERICDNIGSIVNQPLPESETLPEPENPYMQLVSWIGGTTRENAVEIFTPNYDMLLEQAFERAKLPYFDGFTGAYKPFFDPPSIEDDTLPSRWTRVWKIHGSLGWELYNDTVVRTGDSSASMLIYPDHLKYDQISRQPYSALFERFRRFLMTPDSLLICSGFSFSDAQITAVINEALSANAHTAVVAFQFGKLEGSKGAVELALRRPNLSIYAQDAAVIHGIRGDWRLDRFDDREWLEIRNTYWLSKKANENGKFTLGDFRCLARFLALTRAIGVATGPVSGNVTSTSESTHSKAHVGLEEGGQDA